MDWGCSVFTKTYRIRTLATWRWAHRTLSCSHTRNKEGNRLPDTYPYFYRLRFHQVSHTDLK